MLSRNAMLRHPAASTQPSPPARRGARALSTPPSVNWPFSRNERIKNHFARTCRPCPSASPAPRRCGVSWPWPGGAWRDIQVNAAAVGFGPAATTGPESGAQMVHRTRSCRCPRAGTHAALPGSRPRCSPARRGTARPGVAGLGLVEGVGDDQFWWRCRPRRRPPVPAFVWAELDIRRGPARRARRGRATCTKSSPAVGCGRDRAGACSSWPPPRTMARRRRPCCTTRPPRTCGCAPKPCAKPPAEPRPRARRPGDADAWPRARSPTANAWRRP